MDRDISTKTAFLTGASGFVGHALATELRRLGHGVRALVRPSTDAGRLERLGVEIVRGDLAEGDLPSGALAGTVVFHAAGSVGDRVTWESARRVNIEGTRRVLDAAVRAKVSRMVHVSSVAVYGFDAGTYAEDAPRRSVGEPYIDSKTAAEDACETARAEHGLDVRIVRPTVVYGPGDRGMIPRLVELLRLKRLPLLGGGVAHSGLVYIDDVVDSVLAAAGAEPSKQPVYNVSGPDDLTWRELGARIAERHHLPPPGPSLPRWVAMSMARTLEGLARVGVATSLPLTRHAVAFLTEERRYPLDRARDELGFVPRIGVDEGLRRTFADADVAA